jgi:hypothetical protein
VGGGAGGDDSLLHSWAGRNSKCSAPRDQGPWDWVSRHRLLFRMGRLPGAAIHGSHLWYDSRYLLSPVLIDSPHAVHSTSLVVRSRIHVFRICSLIRCAAVLLLLVWISRWFSVAIHQGLGFRIFCTTRASYKLL